MHARPYFLIGLAWGLTLLPLRLPATTVDAPDIDSLIGQSDYVVRAIVKSATPEWREHAGRRYISTKVELDVREVIKGTPPVPLVIDMVGGRIGEDELVIEGMPRFHVGDDNVLFVHGAQRHMFPLVALMHGVYPVLRDAKSGQEYVLRSNGAPLYHAEEVSLPMDRLSAVKRQNPLARPLTAASFVTQIRQRAALIRPNQIEK